MNKKVTKKSEEQISNRVLTMFTLGALVLWGLSYIYNLIDVAATHQTGYLVTKILLICSSLGVVSGIIWFFISKKNGNARMDKVVNGPSLASFFGVLTICSLLLLNNYILGMKLIYVLIPATVILYLVFNVYQRVFFWLLFTEACITGVIYLISNSYDVTFKLICALIIVVISAIVIFLSTKINKGKGSLAIGNLRIPMFEKNTTVDVKLVSLIYGISSIIATISAFIPMTVVFYVPYLFIGFLVCASIYFTIRLM